MSKTVTVTCTPPSTHVLGPNPYPTPPPVEWQVEAGNSISIPKNQRQQIIYKLNGSTANWEYQQITFVVTKDGSTFKSYSTTRHQGIKVAEAGWEILVGNFQPSFVEIWVTNTNVSSQKKIGIMLTVGDGTWSYVSPDPQLVLEPNNTP